MSQPNKLNKPDSLNIKIIIAAHKKYRMPQDDIYLPIHVGAEGKAPIGYQGDNTGNNISTLNPYFCELTGMYWMWKNLKADYLGLAHYRRHFCFRKKHGENSEDSKWKSVLTSKEAQLLCKRNDVIVPEKRHYVIETLESHYEHTHYKEHLEKSRQIIRADLVDEYCTFLFDILFELDKQVDTSEYSAFQARYPGRVGEILFNVWLDKRSKEKALKVKEISHIHMEKINWWNKGTAFLKAKFLGKRYEHGF